MVWMIIEIVTNDRINKTMVFISINDYSNIIALQVSNASIQILIALDIKKELISYAYYRKDCRQYLYYWNIFMETPFRNMISRYSFHL